MRMRWLVCALAVWAFVNVPQVRGAGVFTFAPITGDADSGISPFKTYTHAIDFSGDPDRGTTVNGVPFQIGGRSGPNYSTTGFQSFLPFIPFRTNSVPAGPNTLYDVLEDFFFNGTAIDNGNESLTLSGLTPGTTYATTFYNAGYDANLRTRIVAVTASDGGAITFDQNFTGQGNPSVLRYTFTAARPSITYAFDPANNADAFHQYGFTNEVVPEPAGLFSIACAGLLLLRRRRG